MTILEMILLYRDFQMFTQPSFNDPFEGRQLNTCPIVFQPGDVVLRCSALLSEFSLKNLISIWPQIAHRHIPNQSEIPALLIFASI